MIFVAQSFSLPSGISQSFLSHWWVLLCHLRMLHQTTLILFFPLPILKTSLSEIPFLQSLIIFSRMQLKIIGRGISLPHFSLYLNGLRDFTHEFDILLCIVKDLVNDISCFIIYSILFYKSNWRGSMYGLICFFEVHKNCPFHPNILYFMMLLRYKIYS